MTKDYTIIGYVVDGSVYHADTCALMADEREGDPIFAGDANADDYTCDECHQPLMRDYW